MKIICLIFIVALFLGCQKIIISDNLTFVSERFFKIKNLKLPKENTVSIGSYVTDKDSVVSQFEIQSKYSPIVIKLANISPNFVFNNYEKSDYPTPGYFSTINEGLYEINVSPPIFDSKSRIDKIDFFSDKKLNYQINNDSIKSFSVNFNKFAIQINDDVNKIIYGKIEYYGLKNLDAQMLLYKIQNDSFLFILTPIKKNIVLEEHFLYNYLFNK
ncbi:hypothetical protein K6T82_11340 [Flavobacterium sp. 17A]|uniref:Lipoprotein n=1 Tax=Flavobacterium potami TaxID=2872310 RepID=A0A9X1KQU6_9FLAO|nr:hypothetical protein [Flavobacterium potami]MBZ4035362.1 hypothetical protein [Flavobacterium potami]